MPGPFQQHPIFPTGQPHSSSSQINQQRSHAAATTSSRSQQIMTTYQTPCGIAMAEKQRNIKSLSGNDTLAQEQWAREKINVYPDACPGGFAYSRYEQIGYEGYICSTGMHLITHEMLAAGQGGIYVNSIPSSWGQQSDRRPRNSMSWQGRQSQIMTAGSEQSQWRGPYYQAGGGQGWSETPGGLPVQGHNHGLMGWQKRRFHRSMSGRGR